MKKRIISILLAVLLICSMTLLVSCGRLTAYALVSDAIEKTNSLESMQAKMTMDMSMHTEGMTVEVPISYDIKAAGLKTENPVTAGEMTMSVLGQELVVDIYTEDDYFYMTAEGDSIKVKKGEYTEQYDAVENIKETIKPLPEDILEEIAIVRNEDGSSTVSTSISQERFTEIYSDLVDGVSDTAADGSEFNDVSISDSNIEITVNKNGYISKYKTSFVMKCTMDYGEEAMEFEISADIVVEYINPGEEVTVTPPSGYKNYTEYDADL